MRAMVVPSYGGPDVFEVRELPDPECGPGQVRIGVEFSGVNFTDVRNRRGDGLGRPPMVVGIEVAGRVTETGPGVEDFVVGQPVASLCGGSGYAEQVVTDASRGRAAAGLARRRSGLCVRHRRAPVGAQPASPWRQRPTR